MFGILTSLICVALMIKAIGLALKVTWGIAKVFATILMVLALPILFVCITFVGGIALIVPIVVIGIAIGILKACL